MDPRLGRLYSPDNRDRSYPFSMALRPVDLTIPKKIWPLGPVLDQGQTPQCVAYAWRQWLVSDPMDTIHTDRKQSDPVPHPYIPDDLTPEVIYGEAQAIDGFPGPHDGTSVRAGVQILSKKDFVKTYLWSSNITDMIAWILSHGPVVVGVNWYESMFETKKSGLVSVKGIPVGGHAFIVNGYLSKSRRFLCTNSWGTNWGRNGQFKIKLEDMQRLAYEEWGEVCTAIEKLPDTVSS